MGWSPAVPQQEISHLCEGPAVVLQALGGVSFLAWGKVIPKDGGIASLCADTG